jgi:hypothetical protein
MSPQDVVDIADTVAEEFTKESAEEGDFLIYTVGKMEADDMSFELDTDVSAQTPKDLDTRGVGEGWGGIFRIKPTADGYEVRNAEKGGLVAMIDSSGNFKMLSADESRAELDMDRYNDDLDMKDDELNPGMYIDDEEWEREMGRMEEGEMDNFEAKLPQDIEAMAQELGGFWLYNGSLDGHFLNSEDKEKSRERDIFLGLSIAYFADEDLLNIMDPINGETLSKERDPKKAIKVIKQNAMGLEENKEETKSNKMKKSELKEMIRAAMLAEMEVEETKVFEAEEDEDVEVAVSDEEEMDIEEPAEDAGEVEVEDDAKTELTGDKKDVSDNLEAALEAARALGDEKLVDQIGNTITFFTRAHIVKEDELQDEAEEMLQESLRMKRLAGLIK